MAERIRDAQSLLAGLTDEQRDAVTTSATPLCVLAGAGSGKTRVLTRRIAWQASTGAIDPRRVLAVTFTRRAAAELRRRVRHLGLYDEVSAGTFHSVALAILQRHLAERGRRPLKILARRATLLAEIHPRLDRRTVDALDTEIGWARARMITPDAYPAAAAAVRRRSPRSADFTVGAYAAYNDAKQRRRLCDFDDILALCHRVLTDDARFAAALRWSHRHLLVDEFQDVNPLQFALLEAWLGDESTLVVVGDPNQAIYAWNGAEPDLLKNIDRHLPGTAVIHLRTNFRSTPQILDAAARILGIEPQPAVSPSGDEPSVQELPDNTGDGDVGEAVALARAVRGRHRPGTLWRNQAILARTNAQLQPIGAALEKAGIPIRTRSQDSLLRHPGIKAILDRCETEGSLSQFITDTAADLISGAAGDRPANESPPGDTSDLLGTLVDLARGHHALDPRASVGNFLESLRADDRIRPTVDGVDLSTFHSAKGLEWPIVHLVGLEDGFVPISGRSASRRATAEERRLLYVAATRAQRELHVTWCRSRKFGDRVVDRSPSPWLSAFTAEPSASVDSSPVGAEPEASPGSRFADLLAALGSGPPDDPEVAAGRNIRDNLIRWREQAARNSKVAPQSVLGDSAIDRLAAERPCTPDELAAIVGPGRAHRFGRALLAITCCEGAARVAPFRRHPVGS